MKKSMKLMSMLLAIALAVAMLPTAAFATEVSNGSLLEAELVPQTVSEIDAVEEKMKLAMDAYMEMDTPQNMILVEDDYVVGEIHTDGYVISYDYMNGQLSSMVDNEGNKKEIDYSQNQIVERTYFNNQLIETRIKPNIDEDEIITVWEEEETASANAAPTPTTYTVNGRNMSNLLSDAEFTTQSMTQTEIQTFLQKYNSVLKDRIVIYYLQNGKIVTSGETCLPAYVIHQAASTNAINPKVILCLLQKEQSLITKQGVAVNTRSLYYCMGYGATDGGDMEKYSGFDNQVTGGTKRLKELWNTSNWATYLTVNNGKEFTYNGVTYPATIFPANRATYALYRWTPWVFDTSQTPFSGGNYLFLQAKDMFWTTWYKG